MKELSIEEKAKRYDEALASAKNTIEVNQAIPDIVDCVESLFPELAESRTDERIRKGILHLIGCVSEIEWCKANVSIGEVQTWLDSLKNRYIWKPSDEQIEALNKIIKYDDRTAWLDNTLNELLSDLKKLKEE